MWSLLATVISPQPQKKNLKGEQSREEQEDLGVLGRLCRWGGGGGWSVSRRDRAGTEVWGQRASPKRKWEEREEQWTGLDLDRQSYTKHRKMSRKR